MFYMQHDFNIPPPKKRHVLYMALLGSCRKTSKIITELLVCFVFPSCSPQKPRHIRSCEAVGAQVSAADPQGRGYPHPDTHGQRTWPFLSVHADIHSLGGYSFLLTQNQEPQIYDLVPNKHV